MTAQIHQRYTKDTPYTVQVIFLESASSKEKTRLFSKPSPTCLFLILDIWHSLLGLVGNLLYIARHKMSMKKNQKLIHNMLSMQIYHKDTKTHLENKYHIQLFQCQKALSREASSRILLHVFI